MDWHRRLVALLHEFPESHPLSLASVGRTTRVGVPRSLASMTKFSESRFLRRIGAPGRGSVHCTPASDTSATVRYAAVTR